MKSRILRSKKGVVGVVIAILLLLALVVTVLRAQGGIKKGGDAAINFMSCGGISIGKTGRCLASTGDCVDSVAGAGLGCSQGQICCFDTIQLADPEQAKAFFKNNFKTELEACKTDVTKCDKATERLISIAGAVDEDGVGQVFVVMKKISNTLTTFAIAERTKTFTSPRRIDEFSYEGDACAMIRKKGKEPEQDYYASFELGIGRNNQGELVVFRVGGKDPRIGALEGLRHKKADDATTPLCLVYSE